MKHTYIHDAVIRAWLEGRLVQVQNPEGVWYTLDPPSPELLHPPQFAADCNYRVKPEDPLDGLAKTFGSQCSCRSAWPGWEYPPKGSLIGAKPLDKSDTEMVDAIIEGIKEHQSLDNTRGL